MRARGPGADTPRRRSTPDSTQATLLISNGTDIKTAQNRLGHSTAALTMDIYAHAIEQNDREAADEIGELLGGE